MGNEKINNIEKNNEGLNNNARSNPCLDNFIRRAYNNVAESCNDVYGSNSPKHLENIAFVIQKDNQCLQNVQSLYLIDNMREMYDESHRDKRFLETNNNNIYLDFFRKITHGYANCIRRRGNINAIRRCMRDEFNEALEEYVQEISNLNNRRRRRRRTEEEEEASLHCQELINITEECFSCQR